MKNLPNSLVLFIIGLALCLFKTVHAQTPQKFSFGLNGGMASNKFDSHAIGGDMRFLFNISKKLSIPLTFGFTSIKEKAIVSSTGLKDEGYSNQFYMLKLGVKDFFSEKGVGFFWLLEGGIVATSQTIGGSLVPVVISPALGYGWKNGIDIAIKHEDYAGISGFTGIRLGYWL